MKWRMWFLGMLHAVVGGAANSVAAVYVDPASFNFTNWQGIKNVLTLAAAGGSIGFWFYLKKSPLPEGWDGIERRTLNDARASETVSQKAHDL